MSILPRTLTVSALAVAALATPAVAGAPDVDLRGAPTMRLVDADEAKLRFATDERLARTSSGAVRIGIRFAGGQMVSKIRPAGRHGKDFVYTARVTSDRDLRVGTKYTVRFKAPGQDAVTRKVKLHPRSR